MKDMIPYTMNEFMSELIKQKKSDHRRKCN